MKSIICSLFGLLCAWGPWHPFNQPPKDGSEVQIQFICHDKYGVLPLHEPVWVKWYGDGELECSSGRCAYGRNAQIWGGETMDYPLSRDCIQWRQLERAGND